MKKELLMNEKDLIQARAATQKLLCKTIMQFGISTVVLILCSLFASIFLPGVMDKVGFIVTILFGMVFGIMIGAIRAYNIFWEKADFENTEKSKR